MKKCILLLLLLLALSFSKEAAAHPHVFIENQLNLVFDQNGFSGIKVKWIFDEIYSGAILLEYDKNRDGSLSAPELKPLLQQSPADFCYIKINSKPFPVKQVTNFIPLFEKNRLIYSFFIPCRVTAGTVPQEVRIAVYDESYYIDIQLKGSRAIAFTTPFPMDYSYRIEEMDGDAPIFFYALPQEVVLKFKKPER